MEQKSITAFYSKVQSSDTQLVYLIHTKDQVNKKQWYGCAKLCTHV